MNHLIAFSLLVISALSHAGTGVTYYHADRQGSPVVATDESARVVWRANYRPFGERTQNVSHFLAALENPVWFSGHMQDHWTGLSYMQGRYYHSQFGRFLSMDPAPVTTEKASSFNRYVYAYNNPYLYTDPDGREALLISVKGTGAAGPGLSAATGVYLTFPLTGNTPLDIGLFSAGAVVAGADLSATVNVSLLDGGREAIEGRQVTTSATLPLTGVAGPAVDMEYMIDPVSGESTGASLGVGIAAFPNASASIGGSFITFSLRDALQHFSSAPESAAVDHAELWFDHIAM